MKHCILVMKEAIKKDIEFSNTDTNAHILPSHQNRRIENCLVMFNKRKFHINCLEIPIDNLMLPTNLMTIFYLFAIYFSFLFILVSAPFCASLIAVVAVVAVIGVISGILGDFDPFHLVFFIWQYLDEGG